MKNSQKFDLRKFLNENKISTGTHKSKNLIVEDFGNLMPEAGGTDDDKYTHQSKGVFVKKGDEKNPDAEKFSRDDNGAYKSIDGGGEEGGEDKPKVNIFDKPKQEPKKTTDQGSDGIKQEPKKKSEDNATVLNTVFKKAPFWVPDGDRNAIIKGREIIAQQTPESYGETFKKVFDDESTQQEFEKDTKNINTALDAGTYDLNQLNNKYPNNAAVHNALIDRGNVKYILGNARQKNVEPSVFKRAVRKDLTGQFEDQETVDSINNLEPEKKETVLNNIMGQVIDTVYQYGGMNAYGEVSVMKDTMDQLKSKFGEFNIKNNRFNDQTMGKLFMAMDDSQLANFIKK